MRVEESEFNDKYETKVVHETGNFYIFKKFIIGEVNEGAHFNWGVAKEIIEAVYEYFGSRDIKVAYISNRVHSYSLDPQDWLQFYKERNHLEAFAIVAYNKIGLMNVILEKIFTQTRIKKFNNLHDAIEWVENLKENAAVENDH